MHWTRRSLLLLLVLVVLLGVAAGCGESSEGDGASATPSETSGDGSEDGSDEGSETETGAGDVDTSSPAYQGGFELCEEGPVEYVAGLFGAEPTTKAVANAVAEQVGGAGGEQDFAAGRQGCLDAFAANG